MRVSYKKRSCIHFVCSKLALLLLAVLIVFPISLITNRQVPSYIPAPLALKSDLPSVIYDQIDESSGNLLLSLLNDIKQTPQLPFCPLINPHYERYNRLKSSKNTFFIALNLFNSEKIIPNLALQITRLVEFLGKDRVFISVYENGSTDSTPMMLDTLHDFLTDVGIKHEIKSVDGAPIVWKNVHRIGIFMFI